MPDVLVHAERVTPLEPGGSSAAACRTGRIVFHTVRQPQPS